jgi:hypothetical protein
LQIYNQTERQVWNVTVTQVLDQVDDQVAMSVQNRNWMLNSQRQIRDHVQDTLLTHTQEFFE